jgi:hypothetical protein
VPLQAGRLPRAAVLEGWDGWKEGFLGVVGAEGLFLGRSDVREEEAFLSDFYYWLRMDVP